MRAKRTGKKIENETVASEASKKCGGGGGGNKRFFKHKFVYIDMSNHWYPKYFISINWNLDI